MSTSARERLLSKRERIQEEIREIQDTLDAKKRELAEVDGDILALPPVNSRDWTRAVDDRIEKEICDAMRSIWKLPPKFRPFQLESIRATMLGKSVLLVMPTGGGKSLCFQLPASIEAARAKRKFTVVISPLCSLSEDQVYGLRERGIDAKVLASYTSKDEVKRIYQMMTDPSGAALTLLYVTPEKIISSKRLQSKLQHCARNDRIGRFVIDECHCVSSWGNDFRPSYRQLNILRTSDFVQDVPMMLLTATATKEVRRDIRRALHFERSPLECFVGSFNRHNLVYHVRSKPERVKDQVKAIASDIEQHHAGESGIIYVTSRRDAEVLSEGLNALHVSSLPYHAGLDDLDRQVAHRKWRSGQVRVICATVAFGMGIDKPDVRFVHHACLPKSLENYLQESGRAGRDGKKARCVLWYKRKDVFRISPMVHESNAAALTKLHQFVLRFCERADECRRAVLAESFGEGMSFDPSKHCRNVCDVCLGTVRTRAEVDRTSAACFVISILDVLRDEGVKADVTFAQLADASRSVGPLWKAISSTVALRESAKRLPKMSKTEWEAVIMAMLLRGLLYEGFVATAYSYTSYMRVCRGEAVRLLSGKRTFTVSHEVPLPSSKRSKKKESCTRKKRRRNGGSSVPVITISDSDDDFCDAF